jgi:two-component system sensor histidine kinase HupT/HoxJ
MPLNWSFYALGITTVILIGLFLYILFTSRKTILSYLFAALAVQLTVWSVAIILEGLSAESSPMFMFWEKMTYFGSAFVPVTLLLIGLAFARADAGLNWRFLLLYLVPVVTWTIIWTNDSHHLFYQSYSSTEMIFGAYFYFHAAFSYGCMLFGLIQLSRFAIRNAGTLSVQALLIMVGGAIPLITNVGYTFKLPGFDMYSTPIAFSVTAILYILSMYRFNMLKITPIALQTVVNRISDSFVVVDPEMNIIDYNETFRANFEKLYTFRKEENLYQILSKNPGICDPERVKKIIAQLNEQSGNYISETQLEIAGEKRYFTVEFTPIRRKNNLLATVILFKDITQNVLDMQTIRNNQEILLERERLASLGQLIGGIAHNLKTPIMSVAGGIEQLECLTTEYEESVGDEEVTPEDHREIAGEMRGWLGKMKIHMSYMSDIISTVKDQAAQFNVSRQSSFTLEEMLKRIDILMHHELIKGGCTMRQQIELEPSTLIQGDINSLVQIFDNIIANAVQAYGGRGGEIVLKAREEEGRLRFEIQDFGPGIEPKVQERMFKEMITTKGKYGTGLGLYMAYSTIRGIFQGDMYFETEQGQGTTFVILLPKEGGSHA